MQFTRNPDGIGGALKKIGGLEEGSNLDNPQRRRSQPHVLRRCLSHGGSAALFATHPPLDDRIRRIDPHWDGQYPNVSRVRHSTREEKGPRKEALPPFGSLPTIPGIPQLPLPVLVGAAEETVDRIGKITPAQTAYATEFTAALPDPLRNAASDPFGARALICSVLLEPIPRCPRGSTRPARIGSGSATTSRHFGWPRSSPPCRTPAVCR